MKKKTATFCREVFLFIALLTTVSFSFAKVPSITSFSPESCPVGTVVTITGINFDSPPADNIVFFEATQDLTVTLTVNTYFPDANFRAILSSNYGITFDENNYITNIATAAAARALVDAGADVLVAGSYVFKSSNQLETTKDLKALVNA